MKSSQQEKELLQRNLYQALKYRETYEEIYDHVLAALEDKPGNMPFADAANAIIISDFGGYQNLKYMEENCRRAVTKEVQRQYKQYLISCFKFPFIVFTLLILLLVYFIVGRINPGTDILEWVFFAALILPLIYLLIRFLQKIYIFGDTKKSLRDSVFGRIISKPFSILFVLGLWTGSNLIISTILIMIIIINTISLIKLANDEFKMNIIR